MSIASEISRIQSAKTDIREAIEAKGVTVPDSEHIDTYPEYISQIQQGGGGASEVPVNLESWAYDDWGRTTSATTTAGTGSFSTVFQNSKQLTNIVIKGYTSLPYGAFSGCTALSSVTLPDGLTSLGDRSFYSCSSLTGVTLPDGLTSLGDRSFYGCSSLTGVTLPDGLTSLGSYCFQNCTSLTGITIPSGVTSIENQCFSRCTALTEVTLPDGLTSLGDYCFRGCSSLTEVTIPSGVTLLEGYCFSGCTGLASITVEATTPPTLGSDAFDYTNDCPIYVPCGTADTYKGASGWSDYATRIFENPSCSDTGDTGNTKITYNLQDGTTGSVECDLTERLGNEEISSVLPTMTSCTVGSCAKTVARAFENAPMLSQVTLSEGIETIDMNAFSGCTALTSITIPESTTFVGGFQGCTSLASVTLGSNVTDLVSSTFSGCTSLKDITIPSSVTSLGDHCFSNCTALTSVALSERIETIDEGTFFNCSSLTSITIPQSVTAIDYAAFDSCSALTRVTLFDGLTSLGESCFQDCTSLTEVIIPYGVTSIGTYCFAGCTSLASVTVEAATPPTLGGFAFERAAEDLIIYVPSGSVEEYKTASGWSDYADKIQRIHIGPIA